MKSKYGIIFLLLSLIVVDNAQSLDGSEHSGDKFLKLVTLKLDGKYLRFVYLPQLSLTVSENCIDLSNPPKSLPNQKSMSDKKFLEKCQAIAAHKLATTTTLGPAELGSGGKDPGSVACTQKLNGKTVFAELIDDQPETGSNETLCIFSDGSMTTANSLNAYLATMLINKKKK